MTAADNELAYLHSYASWAGIDLRGIGRLYRVNGYVCGLIDDDLTPVRELTRRVLDAMGSPTWQEPDGMREDLCELRAVHMRRFPNVSDIVWQIALADA